MEKPFGQSIHLVRINNGLPLISNSLIESALKTMFVFHNARNPRQRIFLKPDLTIQGILGHKRKQEIPYIQLLGHDYIDGTGNKLDDLLGGKFYERIFKINSRTALDVLLETHPDFCVFPTQQESVDLMEQYRQSVGFKKYPVLILSIDEQGNQSIRGILSLEQLEKIRNINKDFLYQKILKFKKFLKKWREKELDEDGMLWLNMELERVSPTFLTFYGHALEQLRAGKKSIFLDEKIGTRKILTLAPIHSYRIYGHFALCCLRLFHDIINKLSLFVCEKCGALQTKEPGSKKRTCSKEQNLACFKIRQNKRQYQSYHRKK